MAFPAPSFMDESRYAAVILNNILGGDVNSRLFQGIREKYGLTYSVYSYGSSFSDTGLFHIYAAMSKQQKDRVFELIISVISSNTLSFCCLLMAAYIWKRPVSEKLLPYEYTE